MLFCLAIQTFSLVIFGKEFIMEAILRKNPRLWMVAFYLFMVAAFLYVKPSIAFGEQGRVRPFAVLSYMSVVYILDYSL